MLRPINRIKLLGFLLFLPLLANAQMDSLKSKTDRLKQKKHSFINGCEIGVGIGLGSNTIPGDAGYKHKEEKAASIRFAKNIGQHYQVGIELSFVNMGYAKAETWTGFRGTTIVYTERIYGKPAIPVCLFGNYKFRAGYSIFYAGVAVGYMRTVINYSGDEVRTENNASSIVAGGQIGYQYLLGRHFSIAAMASLRYCNLRTLHEDNVYKSTPIFYYPVTVGASYLIR